MRKAEASAHITRLSPSCPRGGREADGPDPADSFPSLSWGKSASLTSLCCRGCRLHWAQQDSLQDQGREVAGEAEGLGWGGPGALGRPTESTQVAAPCGSPELLRDAYGECTLDGHARPKFLQGRVLILLLGVGRRGQTGQVGRPGPRRESRLTSGSFQLRCLLSQPSDCGRA